MKWKPSDFVRVKASVYGVSQDIDVGDIFDSFLFFGLLFGFGISIIAGSILMFIIGMNDAFMLFVSTASASAGMFLIGTSLSLFRNTVKTEIQSFLGNVASKQKKSHLYEAWREQTVGSEDIIGGKIIYWREGDAPSSMPLEAFVEEHNLTRDDILHVHAPRNVEIGVFHCDKCGPRSYNHLSDAQMATALTEHREVCEGNITNIQYMEPNDDGRR